ncbi:MAG: sigma-70 family RNA polymerase sigma factor [Sphingomonas sp.]|nr:sigma-70 family RNA polymerase sigma factor [Sphingomonas sp.]
MDRTASPDVARVASQELTSLMADVAQGDRHALHQVYERTSAKLFGICLRVLDDRADAEDVLQTVYVTVWTKAGSFDPDKASAITWLAAMTRNRAIDRLRQRRPSTDDLESAAEIPDERPSAVDIIERAEDRARLHECLDELDEDRRTMIRAAFLEGTTYPQLAESKGVPLPTVKSWMRRALLRLRGCMES